MISRDKFRRALLIFDSDRIVMPTGPIFARQHR
jgi:hypothetical protein